MEQTMKISSSPHIRDRESTTNIMGQVLLALMPATLFGIYNFGIRALVIILITVKICVFFEAAIEKLTDPKNKNMDMSA